MHFPPAIPVSPLLIIGTGGVYAGSGFGYQFANWYPKQFLQSARRPEIREDFRRAQSFFQIIEKPTGFSMTRCYGSGIRYTLCPDVTMAEWLSVSASTLSIFMGSE